MQFRFPQPLAAETSTVPLIVSVENSILFYPFFFCLNLFLPTITGCPLVLLFWGFLWSTSLRCLRIYKPLFYLPLTCLFFELENIRLCILSCVSCSLFLIGQSNKETDVKKQLITAGEYRGNWARVLAFLFQNTVVNPGDKVSSSHTAHN